MPTTYAIPNGRTVFDATLFTSTGSVQTVVNQYGFKPDFVWQKARNQANAHVIIDSVRGANKIIYTNLTNAESTGTNGLTTFNSNGFTGGGDNVASNGYTAVAYQWQAGQGTTSSNTNGSLTSTVSVNQTAGFSVVTFSTPSSAGSYTVGHGLSSAPSLIFVKDVGTTSSWITYHASLGANKYLLLNTSDPQATDNNAWNNTSPTSTVFSGTTAFYGTSRSEVAYCWTPIAGFSAFGSYTGNGSADGPFVYTGFRPKFVLTKNYTTGSSNGWCLIDSSRNTYNVSDTIVEPQNNGTEFSGMPNTGIDILSNGFKMRGTNSFQNASSNTYIYMAFAENPFKYANAR